MKRDNKKDNSPVAGWKQVDQWYLQRYDNKHEPELQIFTEEDWEDENKELREYFCAICQSRLGFLKETGTMWRCNECMQYYDTSIQDVPVKDISEPKVKTFPELEKYPTYEENDIFQPFVQGIDINEYDSVPSNVEVLRDDGRIKHIKVKGMLVEALKTMNEMDGRE